jgi:hypothetical protein
LHAHARTKHAQTLPLPHRHTNKIYPLVFTFLTFNLFSTVWIYCSVAQVSCNICSIIYMLIIVYSLWNTLKKIGHAFYMQQFFRQHTTILKPVFHSIRQSKLACAPRAKFRLVENGLKACFPLGGILRAERNFSLSFLISSTREITRQRKLGRINFPRGAEFLRGVENGLQCVIIVLRPDHHHH